MAEQVDKCEAIEGRTVVINGFSASINRGVIKSLLSSFVGVQRWSVEHPAEKTPESRSTVTVLFDTLEHAQKLSFKFRNRSWKNMQLSSSIVGSAKPEISSALRDVIHVERKRAQEKLKLRNNLHEGGRVIVRNLNWTVSADMLKKEFEAVGPIADIQLPCKDDGTRRGFAFIQFEDKKHARQAVNKLHGKKLKGRLMAVDLSVPRDIYTKALTSTAGSTRAVTSTAGSSAGVRTGNGSEAGASSTAHEEQEAIDLDDLSDTNAEPDEQQDHESDKEELVIQHPPQESSDKQTAEDGVTIGEAPLDKEDICVDMDMPTADEEDGTSTVVGGPAPSLTGTAVSLGPSAKKRKLTNDVKDGRTVFLKNLPYNATKEDVEEVFSQFGEIQYCALVMDKDLNRCKGTGFVKFHDIDDVAKCIDEVNTSVKGVIMDRRRLVAAPAVSREESKKLTSVKQEQLANMQDARNLHLAREGLVRGEDLQKCSKHDIALRDRIEQMKKIKLRNSNIVISQTRLCCHNLPLGVDNDGLRNIFMHAAGGRKNGARITECRVMRESGKDGTKGTGKSMGFGFINFSTHQHALRALRKINNNPHIFTENKRPIVEFSLENIKVIQLKEARLLNSKRKINPRAAVVENLSGNFLTKRQIKKESGKAAVEPLVRLNQFRSFDTASTVYGTSLAGSVLGGTSVGGGTSVTGAESDAADGSEKRKGPSLPKPVKEKLKPAELKARMKRPMPKKTAMTAIATSVTKPKKPKHETGLEKRAADRQRNRTQDYDKLDEILAQFMQKNK